MSEIPTTPPELTDEQIDEIFLACGGHYGVSLQGPNQHVFARAILAAQAPAEPVAPVAPMLMALKWYGDEAAALQKNIKGGAHTQAALESLTVLSLDGGERARTALALYTHPKP